VDPIYPKHENGRGRDAPVSGRSASLLTRALLSCAAVMALVFIALAVLPPARAGAATTTYCLNPTGEFSACPTGARTVQPAPTAPTSASPSHSARSLPFTAPSHPVVVIDSGISIGPEFRPVTVGAVVLAADALAAGVVIGLRRRLRGRRHSATAESTSTRSQLPS
jgi:hypothetical protein